MKIAILCPSRGRPERFTEMCLSAWVMSDEPENFNFRLALDADDPTFNLYTPPHHIQKFRTPAGHLFNALAHGCDGDILMAAADDVLFRTQGWDTKVREVAARYPDGLFIASPMNGDGKRRVNHWFTGRQWVDLFGWFMPAHFEHFCDDEWVQEVAGACGRLVYMDDVLVEHMHKKYGKAQNDDGYKSKREKASDGSSMSERDQRRYAELSPLRAADILKLKEAIA